MDATVTDIVSRVSDLVQNPDSTFKTKVKNILVQIVAPEIHRAHNWRDLTRPATITTAADTQDYALPYDFDEVIYMRQTTTPWRLSPVNERDYYVAKPDPSQDKGDPMRYFIRSNLGAQKQPISAATIDIVSSSTSDTSQTVTIQGEVSGVLDSETITLNGTTTATGSKSFSFVHYTTKSATTTGKVTVNSNDADGTVISTIAPSQLSARYSRVFFDPIPSSSITVNYLYRMLVQRLVNDTDVLPIRYTDLYVLGTWAMTLAERRMMANAVQIERKFQVEMEKAIKNDTVETDFETHMVLGSSNQIRLPLDHPFVLPEEV